MATFGERVRERRMELGMKQPELARAAGIRQPTISNIESGRNKGSAYVAQLAVALKCSAHWLATGKGKKEVGEQPAPDPRDALSAREQIVLYLFNGLVPDQQREHIEAMKATFETNQALARQMGGKPLRFVSNAAIEANFGSVTQLQETRKKYAAKKPRAKREPGTAMDDFLDGPE
jgi:transcriptional regulator with XRE-family HTH domain